MTEAVNPEKAGRIAGLKKGEMAEATERLVGGTGWLPSALRTAAAGPGDDAPDHPDHSPDDVEQTDPEADPDDAGPESEEPRTRTKSLDVR